MSDIPMTRLVAHRGYQRLFPENSLLAVRKAIEHGARLIEVDVLFSADGVPVLYHDTLMQRLSGRESAVHVETAEALLNTPLHEPERFGDRFIDETIAPLAALATLLQEHPDVIAFVEMKRAGLLQLGTEAALRAVHAAVKPVLAQTVLISFDYEAVVQARTSGFPAVGVVLVEWEDAHSTPVTASRPDWIFIDIQKVPPGADLSALPAPVVVYEVGDQAGARYWLERGATAIETFDIVGVAAGERL